MPDSTAVVVRPRRIVLAFTGWVASWKRSSNSLLVVLVAAGACRPCPQPHLAQAARQVRCARDLPTFHSRWKATLRSVLPIAPPRTDRLVARIPRNRAPPPDNRGVSGSTIGPTQTAIPARFSSARRSADNAPSLPVARTLVDTFIASFPRLEPVLRIARRHVLLGLVCMPWMPRTLQKLTPLANGAATPNNRLACLAAKANGG